MIDFRYHIVSLISVFLALAVGIVLGAGPLKEAIGDQLSGQVEALRADKEQLRGSLDQAEVDLANRDAFVAGVSGELLAGVLPGRRVALVSLEEIPGETIKELTAQLNAAGAMVTMNARLDQNWVSDGQAKFRQSLASSLEQYLSTGHSGLGSDGDLASALVQSLTVLKAGDENAFSDTARDLQGLLAAGDLVKYESENPMPADMLVFVSLPPRVDPSAGAAPEIAEQRANAVRIQAQLAAIALRATEASAVVSVTTDPSDLLLELSSNKEYADKVSTIARAEELPGQVSLPLALSARATGRVGHYGDQPNSTGPVPGIVRLDKVNRAPRTEVVPGNDPDGSASATGPDIEGDGGTAPDADGGAENDGGEAEVTAGGGSGDGAGNSESEDAERES